LLLFHDASSFTVRSIHEAQVWTGFTGRELATSGTKRFLAANASRRLRLQRRSRSFTATTQTARNDVLDSSSL